MPCVEVIYARSDEQKLFRVDIPEGSTARAAVLRSGILPFYPEIDLTKCTLGVYSRKVPLEYIVQEGDRIEIYRPLKAKGRALKLNKKKPASSKEAGAKNA